MKCIRLLILSILLFFVFIIDCYALDTKLVSFKDKRIYDYADLLNNSEEKKINKKIKVYKDTSKMDIVIVTTKSLDNMSISDYAVNFYKSNSFSKNTVLYVVYITDPEPEIYMYCVGKKATKYYTDSRIGEILKYDYDYIDKKEYYEAFDKYIMIIQGFYDRDSEVDNYYIGDDGSFVKIIPWIEIVILALATTFIVVMLLVYKINNNNKIKNSNILEKKINENSAVIENLKDEVINTNI